MNKKLAIRGHSTRGKEVIELLEMMGGKNKDNMFLGKDTGCIYFIDGYEFIRKVIIVDSVHTMLHWQIFTLEEFLKKYPFKVSDKVFDKVDGYPGTITAMKWHKDVSDMNYHVAFYNGDMGWYTNDTIESLKLEEGKTIDLVERHYEEQCEEMNETQTKENDVRKTGYTLNELIDLVPLTSDSVMIAVREGFEIIEEQGKFFLKKKKSTYPKTYVECCERVNACPTVGISYDSNEDMLYNDEVDLTLLALRKLFICRNAYRKIAGEEMGLDKPWKPDWNEETDKFTISNKCNKIYLNNTAWYAEVLSFPTAEMRDAFYENFKELIEECKELL